MPPRRMTATTSNSAHSAADLLSLGAMGRHDSLTVAMNISNMCIETLLGDRLRTYYFARSARCAVSIVLYRMVPVSYGRELLRSASNSMIPKQAKQQQPQVVFSCRSSLPYSSPRYDCNGRGSQPAGCRRRWLAVPHGRRSCPQGMYRTAGCIR
jgi:hypothetical protein